MANNYIDNDRFEELITIYQQDTKSNCAGELMDMFGLLIDNIYTGFKFSIGQEDARQDCYLLILKSLKNWTPEKGRAFNYFTTVIINQMKLSYTKKKSYNLKMEEFVETTGRRLLDI